MNLSNELVNINDNEKKTSLYIYKYCYSIYNSL